MNIVPRFSFKYNRKAFDLADATVTPEDYGFLYKLRDGLQVELHVDEYPAYNAVMTEKGLTEENWQSITSQHERSEAEKLTAAVSEFSSRLSRAQTAAEIAEAQTEGKTRPDAEKLKADLKKVYNSRGGKENLWEMVPLKICRKNYRLEIRECRKSDILEIDNFIELIAADPSYAKYPGSEEYRVKN